jgi:hypothetical protein
MRNQILVLLILLTSCGGEITARNTSDIAISTSDAALNYLIKVKQIQSWERYIRRRGKETATRPVFAIGGYTDAGSDIIPPNSWIVYLCEDNDFHQIITHTVYISRTGLIALDNGLERWIPFEELIGSGYWDVYG